jgi:hypothetical protein
MSVLMTIHLATPKGSNLSCTDQLSPEQDYVFFGHLVDMAYYRKDDERIPILPSVYIKSVDDSQKIKTVDGIVHTPTGQDFFICYAKNFKNIGKRITVSRKNNAIVAFIKALPPNQIVLIQMSW